MNLRPGRMKGPWSLTFVLLCLGMAFGGFYPVIQGAAAQSGPAVVEGHWAVTIERKGRGCVWRGRIRLSQRGGRIAGAGWARAVKRARRCPDLKGKVEGEVEGRVVRFGFATGRIGTAWFEGQLASRGSTMRGRWRAGRATGAWSAARER